MTSSAHDTLGLVGTTIDGKYEIVEIIGVGGSATVYRANHRIWQKPIAVKVLRNLGQMTDEQRASMLSGLVQEGQLLSKLSERSAAIVQAYDVGTITSPRGEWAPYMVLAWLDGLSLEEVVQKERAEGKPPRTLLEAIALLGDAAKALALAHAEGVAHRDIKPGNLFVVGDPRSKDASVKILDFGIAKVVSDCHGTEGFKQTAGHVTSFTPAYGAPEQFSRALGATGPWTDVYALALTLLELVLGREPMEGADLGQLAHAATDPRKRPTPEALGLGVSPDVEAVFARALALRPSERFQEVGSFWDALEAAAAIDSPASSRDAFDRAMLPFAATMGPPNGALDTGSGLTQTSPSQTVRGRGARYAIAGALGLAIACGVVVAVFFGPWKPGPRETGSEDEEADAAALTVVHTPPCPEGMVEIPGGSFFMGSDDDDAFAFEKPAHRVTLSPYCMDRTEVTVEAYLACSKSGRCKRAAQDNKWDDITEADQKNYDPLCNVRYPDTRAKHPINCVTWELARDYCIEQGGRLPTEAEWEFAARGSDGRRYPWGDEAPGPDRLNACGGECSRWGKEHKLELQAMYEGDDGFVDTAPVGSFPNGSSPFGLADVVGNVWEWVGDGYAEYPEDAKDARDPRGPEAAEQRVIRGGAWNGAHASWVRPTFRFHNAPDTKSYGVGFRCAADARAVDRGPPR